MKRSVAALILALGLSTSFALAEDKKYYDREHKDYHTWNSDEDSRYKQYREEKKIPEHSFARAKRSEQADYWKWRHQHSDDKR